MAGTGSRTPYDQATQVRSRREAGLVLYDDVRYAIVSGFRPLLLELRVPTGVPGPCPVVVWIHGGGWTDGSHRPTADDILDTEGIWRALTDVGLAVASIQYRHSREAVFPACLHDAKAAVRWLRAVGPDLGLDPDRIGALGESSGGHLVAFLAMDVDDELEGSVGVTGVDSRVQAAVAWYAPLRLDTLAADALPGSVAHRGVPGSSESRLIGADSSTHRDLARRASPVTYVSATAAPLLLVHGDRDLVVPPSQSVALRDELRAAGATVELVTLLGADHCFVGADPLPAVRRSVEHLARHLAD